ncbi:hypothetical protein Tco_1300209 [Tanacetum coccineum]
MSSNNASSTVTYTSVSSDSNGPSSWGIPLESADEIPDMDLYKEVAQQGQAHPLSPAYVHDPMELDEHVPLYAPEPEHLEHLVPADDDSQAEDQPYAEDASPTAESPGYIADLDPMEDDTDADSKDYPDEPGTDDEDEDPEEDPSEEYEPENEDAKEDESSENSDCGLSHSRRTRLLRHHHHLEDIPEEDQPPRRRFVLTAPPPGCDVAESLVAAAARAPRDQYDFVDAVEARKGLIRSPGHDAPAIAKAADKAEDVGYVRALQDLLRWMDDFNRGSHFGWRSGGFTGTGSMAREIMPVTRQGTNDAMTPESIQAYDRLGNLRTLPLCRMMQATFGWRLQTERYTAVSVPTSAMTLALTLLSVGNELDGSVRSTLMRKGRMKTRGRLMMCHRNNLRNITHKS